jgi:hypothetical protein
MYLNTWAQIYFMEVFTIFFYYQQKKGAVARLFTGKEDAVLSVWPACHPAVHVVVRNCRNFGKHSELLSIHPIIRLPGLIYSPPC